MSDPAWFASGALLALGLTPLAARLARGIGWVDPRPGDRAAVARKRQRTAVPVAGGAVLMVLLCAVPGAFAGHPSAFVAIALAGLVGLLDDGLRGGLAPVPKVALQSAAALPHALVLGVEHGPAALLGFWLLALVAQNSANTFDHQHGFCGTLGVCGLTAVFPWLAGCIAGFLPHNLRTDREGSSRIYLGDAGSHLIGMAIAVHPAAWPVLALPLVDLGRLAIVRIRAGSAPWRGDRRHLGHRLEDAGLDARERALVVLGALLPTAFLSVPTALAVASVSLAGLLVICRRRENDAVRTS